MGGLVVVAGLIPLPLVCLVTEVSLHHFWIKKHECGCVVTLMLLLSCCCSVIICCEWSAIVVLLLMCYFGLIVCQVFLFYFD